MTKTTLSILFIFLGWFLAQGTEIIKNIISNIRLKRSLQEELRDLKEELTRTSMILERHFQIYSLKGIDPSVPLKLSNYFFENYYNKIFSKLNREQRISYQIIHSHVKDINRGIDELQDITSECYSVLKTGDNDKQKRKHLEKWGDYLKAQYHNIMNTIWHIDHHLSNCKKPDLSLFNETHDSYINYQNEVKERVEELIVNAKKLDKKEF